VNASDLTTAEQTHVRAALRFLRARCGGWAPLAKALRFRERSLAKVGCGRVASASMAVRVARLAEVGVDDLLAGKYPPAGTCPHCGHCKSPGMAGT
jgi:hypothetical protein